MAKIRSGIFYVGFQEWNLYKNISFLGEIHGSEFLVLGQCGHTKWDGIFAFRESLRNGKYFFGHLGTPLTLA